MEEEFIMQVKTTNRITNTNIAEYMMGSLQESQQEEYYKEETQSNREQLEKINAYSELIFQLYEVCKDNPHLLDDENEDLGLETTTEIKASTAKAKKAVAND
jgi:hypothetical protein